MKISAKIATVTVLHIAKLVVTGALIPAGKLAKIAAVTAVFLVAVGTPTGVSWKTCPCLDSCR